jgi:hypothetical protein
MGLVGAVRPELWINPQFWERLSSDERSLAIAHEREHLRRRDTAHMLILSAIGALFRIVPGSRKWRSCYEGDAELAVDKAVSERLGSEKYRSVVQKTVNFDLARLGLLPLSSLSAGALEERLRLLASGYPRGRPFTSSALTVSAMLLCSMPAASLLLHPVSQCLVACFLGY